MRPGTSPNARPPSRSDRSTLNRSPARSCSRGWQLPASEAWRLPCTGAGTRSVGLRKRRARRSRRTMGPDPTRAVLPILIGIVLLSAAWSAVSSVAASSDGGHPRTSAVAGGGTHEIIPDPRRPLIYQVGVGDNLLFLNASTGGMDRYSVEADNPVLLASTSAFQGEPGQLIVDWAARIVYLSSMVPYGVKLISLDTLASLRDFMTDGYPAGIALVADRHLVFALNDFYPYRSALWAFNTSTGDLVREIAMGSELQFVVAPLSTETVLVWTPYGVRAFPPAPSLTPSDPPPGTSLTYLPPAVSAVVWGGIPEVTVDSAQVSVNGVALFSRLQLPQNVLVGFVSPPIQVGTWNITASIAWSGGSTTTTWTITVDPPPPTAIFFTRPQRPIYAGYPILFDAHYSYAQAGSIVAYHWDFGDGSTATGAIVNKTYVNPGTYVTTLGVGTDVGQSDLESRALVVEAFPAITLVPYAHSARFRLPVRSTWNASESEL